MKYNKPDKYQKIDPMWIYSESGEPMQNLMAWRIEAKAAQQQMQYRCYSGVDVTGRINKDKDIYRKPINSEPLA